MARFWHQIPHREYQNVMGISSGYRQVSNDGLVPVASGSDGLLNEIYGSHTTVCELRNSKLALLPFNGE